LNFSTGSAMKSGSMHGRRLLPALFALPLLLAACRREEVTSYRIPKEQDPILPMAGAAAQAPAAPEAGPSVGAGNMASTAVPTAEGPGLAWTAPARWDVGAANPMRKATYEIPVEGGKTELTITAFPSDVGGELANVNRWRGQVRLPPIAEAELPGTVTREEQGGLKLAVVDCGGQGPQAQRLLGVIVPFNGGTWFFKLTGPDSLVAGEKPEFLEFLRTVHPAQP
jgi:hypothetical protein